VIQHTLGSHKGSPYDSQRRLRPGDFGIDQLTAPSTGSRIGFRQGRVLALMAFMMCIGLIGAYAGSNLVGAYPVGAARRVGFNVVAAPGVSRGWIAKVSNALRSIQPKVDHGFRVAMPKLTVHFYSTHAAFGATLHRLEGVWPQAGWDNAGNIVAGVLPLGPPFLGIRHRLAHIYSEWDFDRLTHNPADLEPWPAWLYDGLAEVEAQRIAPELCRLHGVMPLRLASLADPREWWRVRGTAHAGLEYCEAETAAARVVARVGWPGVVRAMHRAASWRQFAMRVGT
jgi:hypothetical protein